MALIDKTAREYYEGVDGVQNSGVNNYGDYQFISFRHYNKSIFNFLCR